MATQAQKLQTVLKEHIKPGSTTIQCMHGDVYITLEDGSVLMLLNSLAGNHVFSRCKDARGLYEDEKY